MRNNKEIKYSQDNLKKAAEMTQSEIMELAPVRARQSKYYDISLLGNKMEGSRLTILRYIPGCFAKGEGGPSYLCRCECGNYCLKLCRHVINGSVKSCGNCIRSKYNSNDWLGLTLNGLEVCNIRYLDGQVAFDVKCTICGSIHTEKASAFCSGAFTKCECCQDVNNQHKLNKILTSVSGHGAIEKTNEVIIGKINIGSTQYLKVACKRCFRQRLIEQDSLKSELVDNRRCECNRNRHGNSEDEKDLRKFSVEKALGIVGKKQGKLTIKEFNWGGSLRKSTYTCDCDCGATNIKLGAPGILYRDTHECGKCLEAPNSKYGSACYIGKIFWDNLLVTGIYTKNARTYWICTCLNCGKIEVVLPAHGVVYGNNKSCGCLSSYGELFISKVLDELGINYRRQVTFDGLIGPGGRKLRLDFLIKGDTNYLALEYNGEQHYTPTDFSGGALTDKEVEEQYNQILERDTIKENFMKAQKIPFEKLRGKISKEDLLKILFKHNIINKQEDLKDGTI